MLEALWLIPAIPFASAFVLLVFGRGMPHKAVAVLGSASIGASALVSGLVTAAFLPAAQPYTQVLWSWIEVAGFHPRIALYLDALSMVMTLVVTFVSFLIHVYSTEFMAEDEGYSRFFGYMNLFVASMVTLLLADNLLLLYLGWEGVGLCSYLLIGFWYRDPVNGRAARKAFIVTRVGDTAFAVGLFLLFQHLGTLDIQPLMGRAAAQWPVGSPYAIAAAALLLGGAVGKSAQLPLQTWLPDAMAGPTPTSALIHAATMVTAGVYLIARTHVLFTLAPPVQLAVAVIGAVTLLMSGFAALVQSDIKRILAYSTISQIGYMFLALGMGAWAAAIFHFMTHAFFKALLFLGAGAVIEALHHEHNIFRMGDLWRELPITFWTFLAASCALAGLPIVTAGYYSKDFIIWAARSSRLGTNAFWAAALFGALLTSVYIFRLVFIVFFGPRRNEVHKKPGLAMTIPMIALGVLSIGGGFDQKSFTDLLNRALPVFKEIGYLPVTEAWSGIAAAILFFIGLFLAWRREWFAGLGRSALHRFLYAGFGWDWLYDHLFVAPVVWFAHADRNDIVDRGYAGLAAMNMGIHRALSASESGRLRWYAAGIAGGTIVLLAVVLL